MSYTDLNTPTRTLLGPGPSNVHPRVTRAMTAPVVGYLDPAWFQVMDETMEMLRPVYGTQNKLTFPIQATGMSGMETLFFNLLEPGDTVLVGVNGFFGTRMLEMAKRGGANPVAIEAPWGQPISFEAINAAFDKNPGARAIAIVHAETSTGVQQPLDGIGALARERGALFILDCVTSLGGVAVNLDANLVDAAYSCTQKCIGCPPGLSPLSINDRAWSRIQSREHKPQSWYFDLTLLADYWTGSRGYHHTPPASMIYALREGLRVAMEEGLDERYGRHARLSAALQAGVEAMGLRLIVAPEHRLPPLTAVHIPEGVDDAKVRNRLRDEFNLEIGGGLGDFRGKAWRIGLMGAAATAPNVLLALSALEVALTGEGFKVNPGAGTAAAVALLA